MTRPVAEIFHDAWRGAEPWPATELERELTAVIETARAANPGVEVPASDFVTLLAERASESPASPLDQLPAADLWLALACAAGHVTALRTLEARTFPEARGVLRRMGLHDADIDEVLQILRERLFVAAPGTPASIVAVAGRGDLGGLVRVAAARAALNLRRKDHRVEVGDEPLFAVLTAGGDDPEVALMKGDLRAAFKAAVERAVRDLEPWQRNVLRMHLLHALSVDEIGRAYQVHRATAARWLTSIRGTIQAETRRHLSTALRLDEAELAAIFAEVRSRVELSFERMLASTASMADSPGPPSLKKK